jgi:glycosyltransferase involved in cell wall biosynthesis
MADQPLTTVVVITCNYGRFLRDAVESAVRQTARPRVLIVDDASTDDTPKIVERLRTEHAGLEYCRLAGNIGLARARNLAADLVTTEWLVYLDADDWLDLRFVERGEARISADPAIDVLATDMTIVIEGRVKRVFRSHVPRFWTDLLVRNTIVQTSFIRRALVQRLGGYDPALDFEDWDFWIRALQTGGRMVRLPGAHVFRREHTHNKSKVCDERAATEHVRAKHTTLA